MMLAASVSIARRFQRSIRLDSDLGNVDALKGFVCQRSAADALTNMATQIARTPQRAFTWTGPYGGGKSSLAVTLASFLGPKGPIRQAAVSALGPNTAQRLSETLAPTKDGWLVVPVVGRRGDPVADISSALEEARRRNGEARGRPRRDVESGRELLERLSQEAAIRPRDGVLLIVDELGKFLEGAANDGKDIYFFQELAEAASRSKGRFVVVGILHQAFEQYATRLGREARDEWAKIQGRFTDVPLIGGVDEVVDLLGRAIVADKRHNGGGLAAKEVAQSMRGRRPGIPADLGNRLNACWPLHPVTAAILGPMSRRRFGQNERSVFGFLASAEPFGFQEFLKTTPITSSGLFGPDRFWDYLRANLEPAILGSNDSHKWAQGADAIERCEAKGGPLHVALAKAIAVIELFRNGSGLSADLQTLATCATNSVSEVKDALADLEKWSVAVFRKHLNAWAVFAGSDFDIEGALAAAASKSSGLDLKRLAALAGLQPILAKKHYHETGSLRWFQTALAQIADLNKRILRVGDAAGYFVLAVPGLDDTQKSAIAACRAASTNSADDLVAFGYPQNGWRIRDLGNELVALETIRSSRPELDGDTVARREIAARIAAVSATLEEELREAFASADWYVKGARVELPAGASLSRLASDLADQRFSSGPKIHSELLNRQRPSSNTQAGVRDLMHAMISSPQKADLGIEGFPVEKGLYSTALAAAGLHRADDTGLFRFREPGNGKVGRTYKPAWVAADALFTEADGPVQLSNLYKTWEAPPFGIRAGLMPVLALAFVLGNRHRFALYCEGRFQAEIDQYLIDILLQDAGLVSLRLVDSSEFRGAMLGSLAAAVEDVTGEKCVAEPLQVARALVRFARGLPPWTQKTLNLSPETAEVRRVLLRADDPHKALFVDLPTIFGDGDSQLAARGIKTALREMSQAYPEMLADLQTKMLRALGHDGKQGFEDLQKRASVVADLTGDLRVDAFAARLSTFVGQAIDLEAIASLAINRPLREWTDRDPDQAALALADFALKFRKAEMLARVKGRLPGREAMAFVIGTGEAGRVEVKEFDVAAKDRTEVLSLSHKLTKVLSGSGATRSVVLAALAEAGIRAFSDHENSPQEVS